MGESVPSSLFREHDSLWMAQDARRHCLEVWEQEVIMEASSHLMGCPVKWECSVRLRWLDHSCVLAFGVVL